MIADASVLILFARAGRLDILRQVFEQIEMPDAVYEEVFARQPPAPDALAVAGALDRGWIKRERVEGARIGLLLDRFPNLGLGELASLALASERNERYVLLDDATARKVAKILGSRPIGCLGIVARAYRLSILSGKKEVAAVVRGLVSSGLWITADVVEVFWESLGGRP